MEENLRRNVRTPFSDPGPSDACRPQLTRMNSASSAVTADSSGDSSPHSDSPFPLDLSTRWTNEQHSSYLNYLEASFVNELQCSMRLCGWSSQYDSKEAVKFGSQLRLVPAGRACAKRESDVYGSGMLCDKGIPVRGISASPRSFENHCGYHSCHLESVSCTAEVTDQNFADEDQEASSSCMPMAKRMKTATADTTSNDQVVPFRNLEKEDISSSSNSSSETEGQRPLLSELPESFHYPKSDLHYFLRGS